jgi:hypothetical protein
MRRYRKSKKEKQILTDNPETAKRQKAGKEIQMKKKEKERQKQRNEKRQKS